MSSTLRRAFAVTGAAVLILALPACAKKAVSSGAIGTVGVSPGVSPGGIDGGTDGTGATDGTTGGATDGATDGTTGSPTPTDTATVTVTKTPNPNPTVTVTAQPTITIDEFKVTQQPQCAVVGTPDAPKSYPAIDITLEWRVSGNVDAVGLSIDDPNFPVNNHGMGTWKSDFNRNDTETLSFPCDTSHQTSTHKYTVSTIGGGKLVTKTITVTIQSMP